MNRTSEQNGTVPVPPAQHILDALTYVGFLWPLWDAKRQTFADMLMRTVVVDDSVPGPGPAF